MNILIAITVGVVLSFLAIFLGGRRDKPEPGGGIVPFMLGVGGAIVGSFVGRSLGVGPFEDLSGEPGQPGFVAGVVGSIVGGLLVLLVYKIFAAKFLRDENR